MEKDEVYWMGGSCHLKGIKKEGSEDDGQPSYRGDAVAAAVCIMQHRKTLFLAQKIRIE
jgi:hypothetical protein